MRQRGIVDELMTEVILYGGLPVRRIDAYEDALNRTGSIWAAELFAFGLRAKTVDAKPLTREQLRSLP